MKCEELVVLVNSNLARVFEKNNLNLIGEGFDPERNYSTVTWKSDSFMLEVYSDPMGGEINCRIKDISQKIDGEWRYIYEVVPPTMDELKIAYTAIRSENEQLNSIIVKLRKFLENKILGAMGEACN